MLRNARLLSLLLRAIIWVGWTLTCYTVDQRALKKIWAASIQPLNPPLQGNPLTFRALGPVSSPASSSANHCSAPLLFPVRLDQQDSLMGLFDWIDDLFPTGWLRPRRWRRLQSTSASSTRWIQVTRSHVLVGWSVVINANEGKGCSEMFALLWLLCSDSNKMFFFLHLHTLSINKCILFVFYIKIGLFSQHVKLQTDLWDEMRRKDKTLVYIEGSESKTNSLVQ